MSVMKKLLVTCALALSFAVSALAADINGKWVGQMTRGDQTIETTITLKADGDKVTGTVADSRATTPITDGKLSGDTVTFSVETQRGKRTFTGKISGNEIKFKREGGQNPSEFVAKKAN